MTSRTRAAKILDVKPLKEGGAVLVIEINGKARKKKIGDFILAALVKEGKIKQ